ncbi:hypothetical protein FHX74_003760 [Friedmanniella endophytica]|uniref:Superinfection immunity protein n=1 Tax=Microlunatus kandeliicorticis TaxID=1759536 RepID=A0A7W3IVT0_9ACTN|nr:superinfection immunity protein [Microlunatus kandeliicorticis]MBA8796119.1 hypothetical protein [Microlunatus kandeliicorticis]
MSQPPYGYVPPTPVPAVWSVVAPPHRSSTAHVVIAWVLAVGTALYLLPWAVAATRNKRNVVAIALINLFLGWSLVGWVAALVMACLNDDRPAHGPVLVAALPPQPALPQYGIAPAPPALYGPNQLHQSSPTWSAATPPRLDQRPVPEPPVGYWPPTV